MKPIEFLRGSRRSLIIAADAGFSAFMFVTCPCSSCSGHLEFEESVAGSVVPCPHCGRDTALFVPKAPVAAESGDPEEAQDQPATPSDERRPSIIVTTGNEVFGFTVERYLGLVRGNAVRAPMGGQDHTSGQHKTTGSHLNTYKEVAIAARNEAYARMLQHAEELAADAVIAMRFDATELAPGITEVFVYGTAVKLTRAG